MSGAADEYLAQQNIAKADLEAAFKLIGKLLPRIVQLEQLTAEHTHKLELLATVFTGLQRELQEHIRSPIAGE